MYWTYTLKWVHAYNTGDTATIGRGDNTGEGDSRPGESLEVPDEYKDPLTVDEVLADRSRSRL